MALVVQEVSAMFSVARAAVFGAAMLAIGCSGGVDVDEIPIGSEVQVTRDDGGLVEGTLTDRGEEEVIVDTGRISKAVELRRIADVRVIAEDAPPAEPPPLATFREITLPAGTALALEILTPIDTGTSEVGASVDARLTESVSIDGTEVLPSGTRVQGQISSLQAAGKVKGRASVAVAFTELTAHDDTYPIRARFSVVAPASKAEDAKKIGIPAAGGAVLGAILGGKKGAAVGATIGGGAGTAAVLLTPGDEVSIRQGATVQVTLDETVEVRVPIGETGPPRRP
jgi:hypothetical protein